MSGMPPSQLREWARDEVADAIRDWLKDKEEHNPQFTVDERAALRSKCLTALRAINARAPMVL